MFSLKYYTIIFSIIIHVINSQRQQFFDMLQPVGIDYGDWGFWDPWGTGVFRTEPHLQTLDGTKYSFNGYGEYILFKINKIKFEAQTRMTPFKNSFGKEVLGTVISSIVFKGQNTDTIQFELKNENSIDIYINGVTLNIKQNQILKLKGSRLVIRKNEYLLKYNNGIRIIIKTTEKQNALSTIIRIPSKYQTKGLLGVMDKDPSNDFTLPDGKILKLDPSNDREIYHKFGEQWRVSKDDSLFTYHNGLNYDSFNKKDFIPKFMSDGIVFSDKNLEKIAIKVCGDDKDCLFDISVTGDVDIGKMNVEIEELTEVIENMERRK